MDTRIQTPAGSKTCISKAAAVFAAMLLFCSCAGTHPIPDDDSTDTAVLTDADTALPEEEGFSSYTAEITDGKENYLLTVTAVDGVLSACLENNRYESEECSIEPPEGFRAMLPHTQSAARDVCRIITNDMDPSAVIPDIVQFSFTDGTEQVCRFCTISDGKLTGVKLLDTDTPGEKPEEVPYLTRSSLYHSEADKFITSIVVDESAGIVPDIKDMVKIHTVRFDPAENTLTGRYERLTEDNLLYFGYAYWGLANNAAVHFTETPFSTGDTFIEMPDDNSPDGALYYYHVDDPRFSTTSDLMKYLRTIFTDDIANTLFTKAPQKYRDINGELCTLTGTSVHNSTLGMLTFTSYARSQDGDSVIYYARQEKYDEDGALTGYVNGGEFRITRQSEWVYDEEDDRYFEQHSYIVSSYRYPYS